MASVQEHLPAPGRRRLGGRSELAFWLLEVAVAAAFAVLAIDAHSRAADSSYVQQHGIRASAVVRSVDDRPYCNFDAYSTQCFPRARIKVKLTPAAGRVLTATVAQRGSSYLHPGAKIVVLLDPRRPGRAELPGAAYNSPAGWIPLLGFVALFAAIAGLHARSLLRARRRHRRARAR